MSQPRMDNGDYLARLEQAEWAQIAAAQASYLQMAQSQNPYLGMYQAGMQASDAQRAELMRLAGYNSQQGAITPGEVPEPEDTTGLRMLEEFLSKRRARWNRGRTAARRRSRR